MAQAITRAPSASTGPGRDGAESDSGDVTWSGTGGTLTITRISLIHHTVPVTITVPGTYCHYTEDNSSVMTPNIITGSSPDPGRPLRKRKWDRGPSNREGTRNAPGTWSKAPGMLRPRGW
jgi:hypothetical protein